MAWQFEKVVTAENSGRRSDISIDANGYLNVVYYDYDLDTHPEPVGYARYIRKAAGTWGSPYEFANIISVRTEDFLELDRPHIKCRNATDTAHVTYNDTDYYPYLGIKTAYSWTESKLYFANTEDSEGIPTDISIHYEGYSDYYCAVFKSHPGGKLYAAIEGQAKKQLSPVGATVSQASIAGTIEHGIHCVWFCESMTEHFLQYSSLATVSGDWSAPLTLTDGTDEGTVNGLTGYAHDLTTDSNGNPWVVYGCCYGVPGASAGVHLKRYNAGWETSLNISSRFPAMLSICLDPENNPHISFVDMATMELVHLYFSQSELAWVEEVLATCNTQSLYPNAPSVIDLQGYIHILYPHADNDELAHAFNLVWQATTITDPVGGAIREGESLPMSVVGTGQGTLSYQWFKDDQLIQDATTNEYTATEAGSYTCSVSSDTGSATSNPAVVTIYEDITGRPLWTPEPMGCMNHRLKSLGV